LFHVSQQDHGTSSMHTYLTPMKHNSAQDLLSKSNASSSLFILPSVPGNMQRNIYRCSTAYG